MTYYQKLNIHNDVHGAILLHFIALNKFRLLIQKKNCISLVNEL
jgi:hypothetical protein